MPDKKVNWILFPRYYPGTHFKPLKLYQTEKVMQRNNDILMPETDLNNKKLSIILKKDSMYGFLNPEAIINILPGSY